MSEQRVVFQSGKIKLEGLLDLQPGVKGAVLSHPHPRYGGNMHNTVVEVMGRVYRAKGYTTLRFNFRGAGGSEGSFDEGRGEAKDVRSALGYLKEKGKTDLDLAGYSFGAWVNARALAEGTVVERAIMVSPPLAALAFPPAPPCPALKLIVTGSRDDIAPPGLIEENLGRWNPEADFQVIEGADHFFSGALGALEKVLADFLGDGA